MAKKDEPPRSQEFIDDSDAALEADSNDEYADKAKSSKGKRTAGKSDDKKAGSSSSKVLYDHAIELVTGC